MPSRILCLLGMFVLSTRPLALCQAHEGHHPPQAVKPADVYRPSVLPDRIILTWTGDPATTQAVTWRTSLEVSQGFAEIAKAQPGPAFVRESRRVSATKSRLQSPAYEANYHTVEFTDLVPGTVYAYRVGDGVNWSEWFQFRTPAPQPEPFSFIYFGDAQNDIRAHWSRVIREAYRDAPKARFIIHAGDLINNAENDAEWGEWFGAGHWLNAMVPNVPVPGNHEQAKSASGPRNLSRHWRPQFALPEHGPAGLEETCYTFTYHHLRVIALNSNERIAEQTSWLAKVLAENRAPWVVCTFHHPIFSTAKDRDNPELRKAWKPLLDRHRVDLVLQGHDHSYGRTGLETPAAEPETNVATGVSHQELHTGTIYVVSVSGPKMYSLNPKPFMKRTAANTQLYQIIHLDGDTLRYEARTATGELYDGFTLRKQVGKPNELHELNPALSDSQ